MHHMIVFPCFIPKNQFGILWNHLYTTDLLFLCICKVSHPLWNSSCRANCWKSQRNQVSHLSIEHMIEYHRHHRLTSYSFHDLSARLFGEWLRRQRSKRRITLMWVLCAGLRNSSASNHDGCWFMLMDVGVDGCWFLWAGIDASESNLIKLVLECLGMWNMLEWPYACSADVERCQEAAQSSFKCLEHFCQRFAFRRGGLWLGLQPRSPWLVPTPSKHPKNMLAHEEPVGWIPIERFWSWLEHWLRQRAVVGTQSCRLSHCVAC